METFQKPLSNLQLELLKLYSRNISENDLQAIQKMLGSYFANKAMDATDKVWDEKGWTDDDALKMVNQKMRTPYKRK
ncbi:MAG: hypothetical protein ABI723_22915 [Bacteroidia bacterium]